jgi:chemotaxis response regulator CheB
MVEIVLITEDDAFATAVEALANEVLAIRRVNPEDAVVVSRRDRPDILAIDVDSVRYARSLIGAVSLTTSSTIVAVSSEAWPGSDAAFAWHRTGADAVLPKPSGPASPTLAGADRDAYARWFCDLVTPSPESAA